MSEQEMLVNKMKCLHLEMLPECPPWRGNFHPSSFYNCSGKTRYSWWKLLWIIKIVFFLIEKELISMQCQPTNCFYHPLMLRVVCVCVGGVTLAPVYSKFCPGGVSLEAAGCWGRDFPLRGVRALVRAGAAHHTLSAGWEGVRTFPEWTCQRDWTPGTGPPSSPGFSCPKSGTETAGLQTPRNHKHWDNVACDPDPDQDGAGVQWWLWVNCPSASGRGTWTHI